MRKKIAHLFLFTCLLNSQYLSAQKIYNTWFFGYHSGMDFNTSPPTPLNNPLMEATDELLYYTSTICDKDGKLLFFTDGFKVWNAMRKEMPKLSGRWPWQYDDMVLPLICPYPGNDSLYYLFSTGKGFGVNAGKLLFTTINMAANDHTGEIVYPQPATYTNYFTVLANNTSFMLAGTAHCNQRDTWIVTIADGVLKSFLISPGGINTTPVTSSLAIPQSDLKKGYSTIKFSANGEKMAIPVVEKNEILVYDFNNQTGVFSNPVLLHLPSTAFLEDIELSPAGSKLYYGSYEYLLDGTEYVGIDLHNIYQFDLEAGSATAIENSRYLMNAYPNRSGCPRTCIIIRRTLQLGPDGRIYISLRNYIGLPLDKEVNVIEYPDRNRGDAFYRDSYLPLKNVYKFINVSYIRSGSFSSKENGIQVRKKTCFGLPAEFSLLYSRIDSVKWDFGDAGSGAENYSSALAPAHNYSAVGIYTVKAVIYKTCTVDTAITQVSIDPDPIVHIPAIIKDTIVCTGNKITLDAATDAATTYLWSDGLIYSRREIDKPGDFLVRAFNTCSSDQKSFTVRFEECPCNVFIPSAFTPNNDGLNDEFKPITECFAKDYRFKIFNRYGNEVFSTAELNKGWNGKYNHIDQQGEVYTWTLQYRNPNNNQLIRKSGVVTLIR